MVGGPRPPGSTPRIGPVLPDQAGVPAHQGPRGGDQAQLAELSELFTQVGPEPGLPGRSPSAGLSMLTSVTTVRSTVAARPPGWGEPRAGRTRPRFGPPTRGQG